MSWDRTGQTIEGFYIGKYKAVGVVESSRVKLSGEVIHYVVLTEELKMAFDIVKYLEGDFVIIREENVTNVIQEAL